MEGNGGPHLCLWDMKHEVSPNRRGGRRALAKCVLLYVPGVDPTRLLDNVPAGHRRLSQASLVPGVEREMIAPVMGLVRMWVSECWGGD
jgi:hypothetical protein